MAHLIDKDALVAEIDRILGRLTDAAFDSMIGRNLQEVKDFINTLEVKEVDLKKHVKSYIKDNFTITDEVSQIPEEYRIYSMQEDDMRAFAKHFFELGLKAKQG